jgi:hypothetical protein
VDEIDSGDEEEEDVGFKLLLGRKLAVKPATPHQDVEFHDSGMKSFLFSQ